MKKRVQRVEDLAKVTWERAELPARFQGTAQPGALTYCQAAPLHRGAALHYGH